MNTTKIEPWQILISQQYLHIVVYIYMIFICVCVCTSSTVLLCLHIGMNKSRIFYICVHILKIVSTVPTHCGRCIFKILLHMCMYTKLLMSWTSIAWSSWSLDSGLAFFPMYLKLSKFTRDFCIFHNPWSLEVKPQSLLS